MSAKKPPPRPPLPRMSTARRGQPTGIAPERSLRNPFSSISIRYSNSAKESDSDEEISIVRKEAAEVSNQSNGCEGIEIEEDDSTKLTQIVIEPDGSANASRPDESRHVERNNYPCETSLKFPNKSLSTQELRQTPEKKTVTKQSTWPSYSRTSESETSSIMKFLRGREREQENEPKSDAPKEGISLPEKELKEETDVGSYPPKSNVDTGSDNNLKANEKRSRSPSPFRLLSRERQVENLSAGDQDKSKASSGISLSSLLASIGKDEVHSEVEEKAADIEENESNPDIVSEVPSSPELISSLNFCPGHFDEERSELSPHLLLRPVTDKSPQFSNFCLCCLVAYIYFVISWPPFVSGLVFGALIAYLNGCAFLWLFCPEDTAAERYHRALFEYRERIARTPKPVYKSVDTGLLLKRHKQEGWMFKSNDYVPDKFDFSSETVPVLASLKGTKLTLSHPKSDGTGKKFDPRSVEERKNTTVLFSRHEHYDIARSKVSLLPSTMSMKKVWSRKCPICVILEKPSAISEDVAYGNRSNDEDDFEVMHTMKQQDSSEEVGILYLFARTGREKEEWFNHLCKLLRDGNSESFGSSSSLKPVCSYPHYMAKLIQQPDKSPSQQSDIAWVNALVGRAFWDVWHDKYWTNKVKERFENKLAKMKKPSFIRDITISDLNLGESLPVITKAHPPVVDKQGTWVDVDVNYSGGLIFTFQGHLNVEGYLSFFLSLGNSEHEELEMAELSRKYEIIDKDSFTEEDEQNESESESPPDSDSDFESPESDFEEFTMKVPHVQLKQSTPNGKSEDGIQSENFDSLTLSSFEGNKEVQENREPLQSGSVSDSEGGEVSLEKNTKLKRQKLSSSKQSLNEETTEKSSVSPGPSEKMSESAPSSPLRTHLGLSTKHGPKHKIFSVIERLAKSKWVKKAAETGIVKRAAERFSNLPIILSVEVQSVQGTLALNIPPPPTNRLWYGFRGTPLLFVSARPKLGDRQVKLTHVTDWIEKKLKQEFRNMFVLPNMEDLPIRLMNSGLEEDFPEW